MTLTVSAAQHFAAGLLAATGMEPGRAAITARCIVIADVWGLGSHGLLRLPYYLQRIEAGGYPPNADLMIVTDKGPVVALDGGGGLGHWQLWHAADIATDRCARYGIAAVSVANSGHCGALGLYTMPGAEAGKLVLMFSNGPAVMAPWGGATPLLSTSPLSAGIPTRPRPTVIDMATSAVARGKIAAYAQNGRPLPAGWALDAAGRPTLDPERALHGLLSPLGGAKGFALALLVEAMAGGLAGPHLSADVPDTFNAGDSALPQRIGHLLIAIDPACIDGGSGAVQARLDRLAGSVVDGGGRLPGARRTPPARIDPHAPVPVTANTMTELRAWADRLSVKAPQAS